MNIKFNVKFISMQIIQSLVVTTSNPSITLQTSHFANTVHLLVWFLQ